MMAKQDIRRIIHSAYSLIRSDQANRSISSLTLDHLLQEHINLISRSETRQINSEQGGDEGNRVSKIDQLNTIKSELDSVIRAIDSAQGDPDSLEDLGLKE
jgi:hypothetical protein